MEVNDKLLQTVINLHYQSRPNVITDAQHIIMEYLKKDQTDVEYDKVLKSLHDLMNDLPSNILIYFLTTVPLPKQKGVSNSTFSELMKKSRFSLVENMQSVLTEYLNNAIPPLTNISAKTANNEKQQLIEPATKEECECSSNCYLVNDTVSTNYKRSVTNATDILDAVPKKKVPAKSLDVVAIITYSSKKLLDLCAEYVVLNLDDLQQLYHDKNETVWKLVNKNIYNGEEQTQCYKVIEDINKKRKWLRMIEAGHITVDAIKEEYGNSEIFLKERHLCNIVLEDAFTAGKELKDAIETFLST